MLLVLVTHFVEADFIRIPVHCGLDFERGLLTLKSVQEPEV